MDGCTAETRSSSSGGDSAEFGQQDLQMTEPMSTEWTDEKHSLYLKSMEASFVDQLYNSMDLLQLHLRQEISGGRNPTLSRQAHPNNCTPSGQFKVLRGGHWHKINFQRPDSRVKAVNESHGVPMSPWIQHFRSARKPQLTVQEKAALQNRAANLSGKKALSSGTATCSKHSYPCRCYSCRTGPVDSNMEVSDQNFVDENISICKTSSKSSSKRMKTQKSGALINDQVVPYGKLHMAENIAAAGSDPVMGD